jgi:hypothetical protein
MSQLIDKLLEAVGIHDPDPLAEQRFALRLIHGGPGLVDSSPTMIAGPVVDHTTPLQHLDGWLLDAP